MVTTIENKNNRSPSKSKKGRKSRCCRVYRRNTIEYIDRSVGSWQAIFGKSVSVPVWPERASCPELARLVKAFLGRDVSDVPREQLSFQSIKKGLPDSCECMSNGMIDKLVSSIGSSPKKLPPGYLDFVRSEVSRLFYKGWDASYESFCLTTSPPLSSVYVRDELDETLRGTPLCSARGSRSTGGCLAWLKADQDEFLDCVLHGEGDVGDILGKLLVVQSAGKPRPLSKFTANALALKPLHKSIYSFLKRKSWLLVGPPTAEKLRKAGFRKGGGSLVSGDYASATDGLSIEVAEVILETALSSCAFVPANIREAAVRALRPLLIYGDNDDEVRVSVGQMMGSYLSFPLLCLQNYLAFRWSLRGTGIKKVPLLINGDDILYQLDDHFDRWASVLPSVGLTVERTKTSVEDSWGTINSTLLEWDGEFLSPSWSARFGMFRPAEHPSSLGRSFASFLAGLSEPDLRFRAGREFFKWHLGELRSSRVSPVSLGFRGLLARRLSKLFSLLELPLSELPPAFKQHDVCYDGDFVSRANIESFGPEELFQSSLELGSQKWSRGWRPVDVCKEAILYCIARSLATPDAHSYPSVIDWFTMTDSQFSFSLRQSSREPRNLVRSSEFLKPFPPRSEVLVSTSVLYCELSYRDGDFEPLPPYEAVLNCGPW
nr:MAG: RNA dependent RNA polymerase [Magnaporthe oryzae botourmiavirus 9-A]